MPDRRLNRVDRPRGGRVLALVCMTLGLAGLMVVSPAAVLSAPISSLTGASHAPSPELAKVGIVRAAPAAPANESTSVNVTFKEVGLTPGSTWSVAAGSPPVSMSNTTVGHHGLLKFSEPNNATLNYTITPPANFGVERIVGKGHPSLTSDTINGTTMLTVVFSSFEVLTFQEIGLPVGSNWSVAIWSSFPHGGPSGHSGSDTVTSAGGWINFTVVRGPWKFNVTVVPANFTVTPAHGTVGVGSHNATRDLKFRDKIHRSAGTLVPFVPEAILRLAVAARV